MSLKNCVSPYKNCDYLRYCPIVNTSQGEILNHLPCKETIKICIHEAMGDWGHFHYLYNVLCLDSEIITSLSITVLTQPCLMFMFMKLFIYNKRKVPLYTLKLIWLHHEYWTSSHITTEI